MRADETHLIWHSSSATLRCRMPKRFIQRKNPSWRKQDNRKPKFGEDSTELHKKILFEHQVVS